MWLFSMRLSSVLAFVVTLKLSESWEQNFSGPVVNQTSLQFLRAALLSLLSVAVSLLFY